MRRASPTSFPSVRCASQCVKFVDKVHGRVRTVASKITRSFPDVLAHVLAYRALAGS